MKREVSISKAALTPVVQSAHAWGLWLLRESREAAKHGDEEAEAKLVAMSDATLVRVYAVADACGIKLETLNQEMRDELGL